MPIRFKPTALAALSALALVVSSAPVSGQTPPGAKAEDEPAFVLVWKDYVVAQKRFQTDLFTLVSDKWPELESIAALQRDQQLATIEQSDMEFTYLAEHEPERIVLDQGWEAFTNFGWKETDSDRLRKANPDFGKLEKRLDDTNKAISEHPNRTGVHEHVLELMKDEVYNSMVERFNKRMDQLKKSLEIAAREAREEKPR